MKISVISFEEARARLPKVGDRLMLTPAHHDRESPELCVVDYVHTQNRWFRVRFVSSGVCNCYKVP